MNCLIHTNKKLEFQNIKEQDVFCQECLNEIILGDERLTSSNWEKLEETLLEEMEWDVIND